MNQNRLVLSVASESDYIGNDWLAIRLCHITNKS